MARFAHARGAGAWLSASPRVQRVTAAHVALLLVAALTAVAVHQGPRGPSEPLALATATGPGSYDVGALNGGRPARASGWAYLSARIRGCESHGRPDALPDYRAQNPTSSASGAYQIIDPTWAGRYGLQHAADATPAQQEAAAAELYRRHGTKDWTASAPCWRKK